MARGTGVDLEALLRRLVALGFPELKRLRIAIDFRPLEDDELLIYSHEHGRYRISVAERLREASRRVLEGGIAHELAHLVADSRLGPRQRRRAFQLYARSRRHRIRDERATEIRQIERGYGRQLLAFIDYGKRLGYAFRREDGLLRRELMGILRSIAHKTRMG